MGCGCLPRGLWASLPARRSWRALGPGEWGTAKMEGRSLPNTNPGSRRSWGNNRGRKRNKRREGTALDKEEAFLRRNAKSGERGTRERGQVREETDWEASQQQDCHLPEGAWGPGPGGVLLENSGEGTPSLALSPTSPSHPSNCHLVHLELSFCMQRTKVCGCRKARFQPYPRWAKGCV